MPKTALYNMEGAAIGEVELSEEIFARPHQYRRYASGRSLHSGQQASGHAERSDPRVRFVAAVVRSTARREPVTRVTMATARLSSRTAASCSLPSPAITSSTFPRRSAALLSRAP